jgi:hypothetical protein
MKAWRAVDPQKRARLGEIALRIAVITAAANHDQEVNEECMCCALEFCDWQAQIRGRYNPSVALDADAACTEAILSALAGQHAAGVEWIRFTRLCQNRDWYKKFSATRVSRVRKALEIESVLIEETEEMEGLNKGDGTPTFRKTGRVQLRKQDTV